MGRPGPRSEAAARRGGVLDRVVQLGRRRRADDASAQAPVDAEERRVAALEKRVGELEALLEGLQDAVHRESVRQDGRIAELERRSEPGEISRALSRDARERGI